MNVLSLGPFRWMQLSNEYTLRWVYSVADAGLWGFVGNSALLG
jgi:hypothetical protein